MVQGILVVCALLFFGHSLRAQNPADCPDQVVKFDNLQLQQLYMEKTKTCYVSADSLISNGSGISRSFVFSSSGVFMVFNSYGNGPVSSDTGARTFMLFPRTTNTITIGQDQLNQPTILLPSGMTITFDRQTAKIIALSHADFKEDFMINKQNKGGFEIKNYSGLLLDFGFMLGNDPVTGKNRNADFITQHGSTCRVKNSEVIVYTNDPEQEYPFKFDTDEKLRDFVAQRCPNL